MKFGGLYCAKLLVSTAIANAVLALCGTASARDAPSQGTEASDQLEEIVVTAQRREQDLQSVPLSVSVFSSETLRNASITSTSELQNITPGLMFHEQGTYGLPTLRGVGNFQASLADENATSVYIDGVYMASVSGAILSLGNIEQIEVLKGPQGTLFGRNATGGVIQVITRDPSQTASVDWSVGYGNFATYDGRIYATAGVTDNLAADIAIYYRDQQDGWGTDITTGTDVYRDTDFAIRNKWLLDLENTQFTLSLDYSNRENDAGHAGRAAYPNTVLVFGSGFPGFFNVASDYAARSTTENYGASLRINHDLDWARLVSISAWRGIDDVQRADAELTPQPVAQATFATTNDTFTQELQLVSPIGSKISWIVGAYYLNDTAKFDPFKIGGAGSGMISMIPGTVSVTTFSEVETESYAGFADVTLPVLPRTHLTAGVRYTEDSRNLNGSVFYELPAGTLNPLLPPASQSDSWSKLTYRAALDYQFTDAVMAYVQVSRGFKSGVYNTLFTSMTDPPVRPAVIDAAEVGLKSEWFDRRLRLNLAAFHYDYEDIQITQIDTTSFTVRLLNAAAAEIKGAELEIDARPIESLTLHAAVAYLDATFERFDNAPIYVPNPVFPFGNVPAVAPSLASNRLPYSPELSFDLRARYEIPSSIGRWDVTAGYSSKSESFGSAQNTVAIAAYGLADFTLGWTSDNDLSVRLWVANAFDEEYLATVGEGMFGDIGVPGAPRTFGVTLSGRW